jgi:hypothetical protein
MDGGFAPLPVVQRAWYATSKPGWVSTLHARSQWLGLTVSARRPSVVGLQTQAYVPWRSRQEGGRKRRGEGGKGPGGSGGKLVLQVDCVEMNTLRKITAGSVLQILSWMILAKWR